MKVIALPEVQQYLESLKKILFEKEYFGFEDTAKKYVEELFDNIKTTLPIRPHKPAPKYFDKYGKSMKYAIFRVGKNKHTTWYAFFKTYKEHEETIYLIRYIANNHTVAHLL